jgi:hypothetical protein
MRIDLHTHLVPRDWEDWAAKFGGGQFGADHVVLGSDDPVGALAEAGLSAADRGQIEGGAAVRFLGLV